VGWGEGDDTCVFILLLCRVGIIKANLYGDKQSSMHICYQQASPPYLPPFTSQSGREGVQGVGIMFCAYSSISFGGLGSSKRTCMDGNTEGHTSPPWAFYHTQPLPFLHTSSQWGCCCLSEAGWGTQGNTHNSNLHGNPCNVQPNEPPIPLVHHLVPPPPGGVSPLCKTRGAPALPPCPLLLLLPMLWALPSVRTQCWQSPTLSTKRRNGAHNNSGGAVQVQLQELGPPGLGGANHRWGSQIMRFTWLNMVHNAVQMMFIRGSMSHGHPLPNNNGFVHWVVNDIGVVNVGLWIERGVHAWVCGPHHVAHP
jgi:hypothetical protein